MIRLLTILLIFFTIGFSWAQEGDYFLSHFIPPALNSDHQVFDLEQDEDGIVYMAHKSGIFTFDGRTWTNIPAKTSIFSLARINDDIYCGGPEGFSRFMRDENFTWTIAPLNEPGLVRDIIRMIELDSVLYGISTTNLYSYDLATGKAHAYSTPESGEFVQVYRFEGKVHILDASGDSYTLLNDQLRQTTEGIASRRLTFVAKQDKTGTYLAADKEDELWIYKNGYRKILTDIVDGRDRDYLAESEITAGLWVNDSLVVVSTLKGGVVFLNPYQIGKEQRNVQKVINHQNDLPDNEVFTLNIDDQGAVWVGHEKGFTRVAPDYPFRRYDRFPGLVGKIQNAYQHKDILYVGTTQGLFYLQETPVYENITSSGTEWVTVGGSERKGFFNRLFGKKDGGEHREKREVVRTKKKFHSIQYEFKRVAGVQSKVFHLAAAHGRLYCGGLDGLFEIEGDQANRITDIAIKFFHYSERKKAIYASTYDGNVIRASSDRKWGVTEVFQEIIEPVDHIFENEKGQLFLSGIHTVFNIAADGKIISIPFENPFYEETYGVAEKDSVYLVNKSGIYRIDLENRKTIAIGHLGKPGQLLRGAADQVWIQTNSSWLSPGTEIETGSYRHLMLLDRIKFITGSTGKQGLWVIAENGVNDNFLYQLLPRNGNDWFTPKDLYLQEIQTSEGNVDPFGKIRFEQESSNVTFVFRQPDYSGIMDTEYEYTLTGEQEERQDWSELNNLVKFNYLPAGDYTLKVRSRNALGQIREIEDIQFRVLAPYWKRTWFYALEFAIIALMLLISMRMKAMGYKYRLVSRLLALLTLITIIELIQTLAESKLETETSPVFGFVIQVLMAILILPVEEILRKYIFKEKHVKVFDIFSLRETRKEPSVAEHTVVAGSNDEL